MPVQNSLEVEVTDLALPDGFGVAKIDGHVVFIPDGVIGDILSIRLIKKSKRFLIGIIEKIISPSPFRLKALCPHANECGGCSFQNLSYHKQLEIKKHHLVQTLKRIGGIKTEHIEIKEIIPSPDTYFYRNNLELSFGTIEGQIDIGMRERVTPINRFSSEIIPIESCAITSSLVENIIPICKEFVRLNRFEPYNPHTNKGFLRHLTIRESKLKKESMLIFETTYAV